MTANDKQDLLINSFAKEALRGILQGIFSNSEMFIMMEAIAKENKHSLQQEVIMRAWYIGAAMVKDKSKYISERT